MLCRGGAGATSGAMSSPKPERLEGHVRDLVQSGEGAVETARGVLLVRGVLPGEDVVVECHTKERKGRARLVKVLVASDARVEPPCQYVERCGGCALMHVAPALQARLRRGFLESALRKAGLLGDVLVGYFAAEPQLAYRQRARLAFHVRGKEHTLGFRREGRLELVDVQACAVLSPSLNAAVASLRSELLPDLQGEGEVRLYEGAGGRAVAVIVAQKAQTPALYTALSRLVDKGFAGVSLFTEGAPMPASFGDLRIYTSGYDGQSLVGPMAGFSQANAAVNRQLVARVAELAVTPGMRVLELYAGHGNLTVALAPQALSYTALERDVPAVTALQENMRVRGLTVKAVAGDAAALKRTELTDVVVLDPPRTGQRGLLTTLAALKPKRIVYVSCDPATLARDLGEICGKGYQVDAADAFDMFPHTAELECVVRLVRG
jgi:23S rRNA (uracil1939-C5)-methyltransferase